MVQCLNVKLEDELKVLLDESSDGIELKINVENGKMMVLIMNVIKCQKMESVCEDVNIWRMYWKKMQEWRQLNQRLEEGGNVDGAKGLGGKIG